MAGDRVSTGEQVPVGGERRDVEPSTADPSAPDVKKQTLIAYGLPNPDTESEISRLDIQHNIWALSLRGLSTTPSPSPDKAFSVLDIGCGTGAWSLSYAQAHPSAHVLGVDLNPPQPKETPSNCRFLKANAEESWEAAFLDKYGPFDLIHARMLVLGIRDWDAFYARCYGALKPGGWLEAPDCTLGIWSSTGPHETRKAVEEWGLTLEEATEKDGRDWRANERTTGRLKAAGFLDVEEQWFEWPAGFPDEDAVARLEEGEQERLQAIASLTLKNCQGFTMPVSKGLLVKSGLLEQAKGEELGENALKGLVDDEAKKRRYHLKMSYHKGRKPSSGAGQVVAS